MKKAILAIALLFAFTEAFAQNLDQKVEVTNTYISSAGTLMKVEQPLSVPDSVTHFDYRFDYDAFETPYKGAYEFKPYLVRMQPQPSVPGVKRLYLRADAGWTLHPSLHALWTPVDSSRYSVTVYNDFDGYYGRWQNLDKGLLPDGTSSWGYAFSESFGASAASRFKTMNLSAKAGYDGLFADGLLNGGPGTGFHSAALQVGLSGHEDQPFPWKADVDYRYGYDALGAGNFLHVNSLKAGGSFTAQFKRRYFVYVDMLADMEFYAGSAAGGYRMHFDLTPYGMLYYGDWDFRLGLRLGYALNYKGDSGNFRIFPSCEAAFNVPSASLRLFAGADGGYDADRYIDRKRWDPHYNAGWALPECTAKTVDAYAGVQGGIGKHFHYGLRGGYARYVHRPFASAMDWYAGFLNGGAGIPGIVYTTAAEGYVSLKLNWDADWLDVDGGLEFRHLTEKISTEALSPPMFSGSLRAVYNYRKRVYAGLWFEGETARATTMTGFYEPVEVKIPGWADLGVMLEYRLTPSWGLRFQAGNLLGSPLRKYSPYFAETGRSFTLGLTLIL